VCRVRQETIRHVNNPVQASGCSAGLYGGICEAQMFLQCDMRNVDRTFEDDAVAQCEGTVSALVRHN
jgi:hypothetical protein